MRTGWASVMGVDIHSFVPRDRRSIEMRRVLSAVANLYGAKFLVQGSPEPAIAIFSPEALLPVVALHAQMEASASLGLELGIEFEHDDEALLGVVVNVPALTGDSMSVMRGTLMLQAAHRVFGLAEGVQIEVLPVIERYDGSLIQRAGEKISWPVAQVSRA